MDSGETMDSGEKEAYLGSNLHLGSKYELNLLSFLEKTKTGFIKTPIVKIINKILDFFIARSFLSHNN